MRLPSSSIITITIKSSLCRAERAGRLAPAFSNNWITFCIHRFFANA
jgi:hypothetical protein